MESERIIPDHELGAAVWRRDALRVQQLVSNFAGAGKTLKDIPPVRRLDFLRALEAPDAEPNGSVCSGSFVASDETEAPVNLTSDQDKTVIANGFQVVPVCGKAPRLPQWEKGQITTQRVSIWRAQAPDHIGTGARTGNAEGADPAVGTLFVLDVDLLDAADLAKAETLAVEVFGPTPLRRVGRKGCALFYRKLGDPSAKRSIDLGIEGKVEIFGRGQVVLFGIHPDTQKPYRWTGEGSPLNVPLSALPEATDAQVDEYDRRLRCLFNVANGLEFLPPDKDTEPLQQTRRQDPITVRELIDLLAHIDPTMKGKFSQWIGITKFLWHGECLLVEGEQPPDWHVLTDDWCRGELWRKRTGDMSFTVSTYPGGIDALARLVSTPRADGLRISLGTIVYLARAQGHSGPIRSGDTGHHQLEIGSDIEMARCLLADLERQYDSGVVYAEGEFYCYDWKRWAVIVENDLRLRVHHYDGQRYGDQRRIIRLNKQRVSSILHEAAVMSASKKHFDAVPKGINAANGFIRFSAEGRPELVAHDPEHRARHVLNYEWNPEIDWRWEAPLLWQLLTGCFKYDQDQEQRVALVAEIYGAAALGIVTKLKSPKAIVLHGRSADNGKSQILDCARGLLPKDSVEAIPPAEFGDDRKVVHLVGSLLNAVDELGSAQAISSEVFKNLVTGEPRTAREVYKPSVQFRSKALHVFATNTLPSFGGGFDRGVQRRLLVLPFNRPIPSDEKIPEIGARIVREEGAALLAFAVEGASRLIRQGHFTEPQSCRAALREWIHGADPVIGWMAERTEYVEAHRTPKKLAYTDFATWAGQEGYDKSRLPAINTFVQRVLADDVRIGQVRNNKEGERRQFVGLRLKEQST